MSLLCLLQLFNLCWYFLLGVGSALDTREAACAVCT